VSNAGANLAVSMSACEEVGIVIVPPPCLRSFSALKSKSMRFPSTERAESVKEFNTDVKVCCGSLIKPKTSFKDSYLLTSGFAKRIAPAI
jgi:hypothetical protein